MPQQRLNKLPSFARSLTFWLASICTLTLFTSACGDETTPPDTNNITTSGNGGSTSTSSKTSSSSGPDLSTVGSGGATTSGAGANANEGGMGTVSHDWGKTYGSGSGTGQAFLKDLAVDSSGNSIVVGAFTGSIDFGSGTPLTSTGNNTDIFVAKYGPSGDYVWAKKFGDSNNQSALSVAADSNGDIALCGYFYGNLNFGGSNLSNSDQFSNIYVAKLLGASGSHSFSKAFTNSVGTNDTCEGITIDSKDNILITGRFQSNIDFGGGQLTASGGNGDMDVFVAKFASNGSYVLGEGYGGTASNVKQEQIGLDIATAIDDSFAITGATHGPVDFGAGEITSPDGPRAFVARFKSDGTHQLSRVFDTDKQTDESHGRAIAFHSSGDLFVSGTFDNKVTIETEELTAANSTTDMFVARYDANSSLSFATSFGGKDTATVYSMDVDSNGFAVISGEFQTDLKISSQTTLQAGGGQDAFVMKVGSKGNGFWGYSMGEALRQTAQGVAVDSNGDTLIAGSFSGTIDLGQGPIMGGNSDFFIAKFGP